MSVLTPQIRIDAVRVVHDDGLHNAFTDLCSFGGRYYLTFRSCPDGHMIHPTSRIVVLASSDAVSWERVHSFAVPGRDVRDPHFLTLGERLFVISGAVRVGPEAPAAYDIDQHQGFCAWTEDGTDVARPARHGGYLRLLRLAGGEPRWRGVPVRAPQAAHGPRAAKRTSSACCKPRCWRAATGFSWTEVGRRTGGIRRRNGVSVRAGRIAARDRPQSRRCAAGPRVPCRTAVPRMDRDASWTATSAARCSLDGAATMLVGGRKTIAPNRAVTTLYWLVDDGLHEAAELPSAGDNSYPGFVELGPTRALLSYYSSPVDADAGASGTGDRAALRRPSAIHLAELSLRE